MIDNLSFRILQHCRDDFGPITALVDGSTSKTTLYRHKGRLVDQGLLEYDGKNGYRTTEQGLHCLHSLFGDVPEGLETAYPPLKQVPTPYHMAAIELAILAVSARKHNIRSDRYPAILVIGQTLKWKTSAGIFLCHTLGLDPATHVVNLSAEYGKSLWLRKTSKGEISYKRELLEAPLVVFDEYQNADPECRRRLKIWMDGRKVIAFENERLTIQATSFVTMNPRNGKTLEERLGLERAQIRRCIVCDLTDIQIPDLAIKGEEILRAVKAYGPLALPKPRYDCEPYKAQVFELLGRTLNRAIRELVDIESLVMLSSALTGWMEPEQAIRRVLYDTHLLYQTLGWTLPDWQLHVASFPQMAPRDRIAEASSTTETVPDRMRAEAFRLLDSGASTVDLVTKLGFSYEEAHKYAKEYADLKSLDSKTHSPSEGSEEEDEDVLKLGREVRIAELQHQKAELLRPLEADKMLADLRSTLDESGNWKKGHCSHMSNNYCTYWRWEQRPNRVEELLLKDGKWFIVPTTSRCAVCSAYHEINTANMQSIDHRLSTIEGSINTWEKVVKPMEAAIAAIGGHNRLDCSRLENGYCMFWQWSQRPDDALTAGTPYHNGKCWYIKPTDTYCALCSNYQKKA